MRLTLFIHVDSMRPTTYRFREMRILYGLSLAEIIPVTDFHEGPIGVHL